MNKTQEPITENLGKAGETQYVATKRGLISRRIVDEKIYRLELERIFARCWLYLAHETASANEEVGNRS